MSVRSRKTRSRPRTDAGFTVLEATIAGGLMLVVIGSAVLTTNAFTSSSEAGRKTIEAVSNTNRANYGVARELMNATVLDPHQDMVVYTTEGEPVPDEDEQGEPIVAEGPVFRLTKNVNYRLSGGQVTYDRITIEYRVDTAQQDLNGDRHGDQLLRIVDPDGDSPRYTVIASRVLQIQFRKHGAMVKITTTTRGSLRSLIRVDGVYQHDYHRVVQTQVARPRNF